MSLIQFMKSKTFLKQLGFAIVGLLVFVFVVMKWLHVSTNHDQKIEVPNLEKMSLSEVEKTLDELDLKLFVIDSASFNPDYPKKSVIDQDPEPGDFVKENRKIYLSLNPSGYRKIAIPDVFDKTKRQVETHLKSIGFRIGEYYYIPDLGKDVVRKMKFNEKELKVGDLIPKNSEIDLILGDGKASAKPVNETSSQ